MDPNQESNLPLQTQQPVLSQEPIVPQSVQQMTQPKFHSSSPKVILIFLGIMIVLSLIGGAYYLGAKQSSPTVISNETAHITVPTKAPTATPTLDPTADWKRYTSANGFSVKYPPTWTLRILTQQQKSEREYSGYLVNRVGTEAIISTPDVINGYGPELDISLYNNPGMLSLSQFIIQHTYDTTNLSPADDEKKEPDFSYGSFVKNASPLGITQEWVINRMVPDAHAGSEEALIAHGNQVIGLFLTSRDDTLMDTFLSTFKFTQ